MYSLQVDMPAWAFVLHSMQDPYLDKLTFPAEIPAGNHVIRAEVSIINDSDQPLNFQSSSVRLLDADGVEYSAGSAQGREPRLVSQALPGGERSRGSVWFIVPDAAEVVEVKFYGPTPQFRVRLDGS
jgi:multidrug efflux pump subunit AcrA (membrane-fusion protein)